MVLEFDPTTPVHRPADLARLVAAVVGAADPDETDWLEWKRTLDLTAKEAHFKLAREILAFANRDPFDAARHMGGYGYLVVGAEPGNVPGVAPVDGADLDLGVRRYFGDDGPQWSPQYVRHDKTDVLVVKVEPPRDGDPMFLLRQEFTGARDGTVYVRKGTRAEPASAADTDRLVRRLQRTPDTPGTGPDIAVRVVGDVAALDAAAVRRRIDELIAEHADHVVASTRERHERQAPPPALTDLFASWGRGMEPDMLGDDWRPWVETVREWQELASAAAWDSLLEAVCDEDHGAIRLRVENLSERNVRSVRVTVHLSPPAGTLVFDDDGAPPADIPDRPRAFRPPHLLSSLGASALVSPSHSPLVSAAHVAGTQPVAVDRNDDGTVDIHFTAGDLRPRETATVGPAFVVLTKPSRCDALPLTWTATSKDTDGRRTGAAAMEVAASLDAEQAAQLAVADVL